jgi:hypothetical protein
MSKLQTTSVTGKETIYVDIDDEITGIIDKVRSSSSKVVALVLPKRATVLQSVVNMKLLKRTADDANKNLVLVTSEAGLIPLAGSVGLHVAATPTSKPAIPPAPEGPSDEPEDLDGPLDIVDGTAAGADDFDSATAGAVPVGELAAAGVASKIAPDSIDEDLELDDDDEAAAAGTVAVTKPKKNKKLAVPNFDSFRKKLLLAGGVLVLLIVAWIFAFIVMPHAKITIHTDTSNIPSNLNLTLDTVAKTLNTENKIVPAAAQTEQKSYSQQTAATGQQNNGTKATGSVKLSQSVCAPNLGQQPADIPIGSSVTSGGNTYITQETGTYTFSKFTNGNCALYNSNTISISALKGGTNYNASGANFSGPSSSTGSGSASGGTDNITKVVAQSDIDNAKSKINSQDTSGVKQQLITDLQTKGLQAITTTFLAGEPQVTTSAKAGDAADTVTVTEVVTYDMLGVKQTDLKALVVANVTSQLDKGKQVILDDGVKNAKFSQQSPATATGAGIVMQATSVAGPEIDLSQLKNQVAGKKSGEVKNFIKQTPGVTSVDVKYSPFWVSSTPKKTSKITIILDKANTRKQ